MMWAGILACAGRMLCRAPIYRKCELCNRNITCRNAQRTAA